MFRNFSTLFLPFGASRSRLNTRRESNKQAQPEGLKDPQYSRGDGIVSRAKFDYVDLLILKELEKEAPRAPEELSRTLNICSKSIKRHFNKHILRRGLIEALRIRCFWWKPEEALWYSMSITFSSESFVKSFINTLYGSPIVQ
ncbi:MAG: hypothetical protein DRJ40_00515 [Thermoprotei archaeon]|nr:MAG: hypothetical protein DRJ40_00515 [Thermoprotei archaeon]